jgi:Protein of unknown function (DUF3223)
MVVIYVATTNSGIAMAKGKPVILSKRTFPTQGAASEFFSNMLHSYKPGDRVTDADAVDLASALDRHPSRDEKVGIGIDHFEVQSADFASQCFRVVRIDGTWARFSYKACVAP